MGVIRVQKNSNYVVMNKTALHDPRLSWKAKGLHAYMLSMPDDWKFYDDELEKHAKDGKDALKSAIKELKQYGYMRRERRQNEQGKFEWETIVYEEPYMEKPSMEKPSMEKPSMEKPSMENPQLLNNKELNNDLLSNKENLEVVVVVNAHRFYQENFGPMSPFIAECITKWVEDTSDEIVIEAMKRALKQQKKWNYAEGILQDWMQNNLRTIEDIEAYEREFHRKREEVNNREVPKHRRGVSRSTKEGKSYEQILREAEAARRAWGWKG
ncbi:DnaD domain-containing protein [Geobacillus stearothermophilus]|uniref:DnaD domain-containing protein n=1 Tax=Geobacillus stearothermophilus TaxID=1422 RepID=UPI002E1CA074|nr:DnaD domain protein [Geobacillus stearothermophilus]